MTHPWAIQETRDSNLGDTRLNRRLTEVLGQLGARPAASIPAACGGQAETEAAYRLFDNEKADLDSVLAPHVASTRQRIAGEARVILAQDTTEIDLTRPQMEVAGAGVLDSSGRRGLLNHLLHAFTPDGTPLGTLKATTWARPPESLGQSAQRKQRPIEQKESYRWIECFRRAAAEARQTPGTRFVAVADSEADIFELLAEAAERPENLDWIVRACQDRAVEEGGQENAPGARRLVERLLDEPPLYTQVVRVRGRTPKVACEKRRRRQPRVSRKATVEVRAVALKLLPPHRADRKLPPVAVHAVLVREAEPPAGEPPIEWLLLTSLAIDTHEAVREAIASYAVRWMIEVFFRTLKTGCRIEQRRFESVERFLPCLAVYLIVTWRTLYLCRMGRRVPDIDCEAVFEPHEWKSAWRVVHGTKPPSKPPTLREMIHLVARLGGFIARGKDAEPGPQTIWLGLQRLHDIALCWKLFGPEGAAM